MSDFRERLEAARRPKSAPEPVTSQDHSQRLRVSRETLGKLGAEELLKAVNEVVYGGKAKVGTSDQVTTRHESVGSGDYEYFTGEVSETPSSISYLATPVDGKKNKLNVLAISVLNGDQVVITERTVDANGRGVPLGEIAQDILGGRLGSQLNYHLGSPEGMQRAAKELQDRLVDRYSPPKS